MVKQKQKQEKPCQRIARWVVLFPAICLTWPLAAFTAGTLVMWPFFALNIFETYFWFVLTLALFIVPGILMFFVAWTIAPKYKIWAGVFAIILCAIWCACLFYGAAHMAY